MICDRQTDELTDGRPGKNNMSPDPEGGRHNFICFVLNELFVMAYDQILNHNQINKEPWRN